MWITLALRYWKPLAVCLLMLIVYGTGYMRGVGSMEMKLAEAVSKQRENNLKINAEVSDDYQKEIADLRKRYDALRLRTAGKMRNAETTGRHYAAPGGAGLHWQVAEPIGNLMLQADLQTQQLIACQTWVRGVTK